MQLRIKSFPPGEVLCNKNGIHSKWFYKSNSKSIYIPKSNWDFAEKLANKKYYSLQLKECEEQLKYINKYLYFLSKQSITSDSICSEKSPYYDLLNSSMRLSSTNIRTWAEEAYEHNTQYPDHLIHKTILGHNVRSKSEVIIANALCTYKIPYRYECKLKLNDIQLFPDFTILHPKSRKIYYWEHFGLIDNEAYRKNAFQKLSIYGEHGIFPTINLITTYETQAFPINSEKVHQIISEYFL